MEELTAGSRVEHPRYGQGIISKVSLVAYEIFFEKGGKVEITKRNPDLTAVEIREDNRPKNHLSLKEVEDVMINILERFNGLEPKVSISEKWQGGTLELKPGKPGLQSKEIPIETFFHKIVMLRDRLRVLEQNINTHPALTDDDRINLQQYITRIYGSLTTFNLLFAEKEDYFVGSKS